MRTDKVEEPDVRVRSGRVNHAPELNGRTTIRSDPWHLDDWPGLCSGRSVESRQCRRPAKNSRASMLPTAVVWWHRHVIWVIPIGGRRCDTMSVTVREGMMLPTIGVEAHAPFAGEHALQHD